MEKMGGGSRGVGGIKQIACLSAMVGILNSSFAKFVRKLVKPISKIIYINDHKFL